MREEPSTPAVPCTAAEPQQVMEKDEKIVASTTCENECVCSEGFPWAGVAVGGWVGWV